MILTNIVVVIMALLPNNEVFITELSANPIKLNRYSLLKNQGVAQNY